MVKNISGFEFEIDDASGVIKSIRSQSFFVSVGDSVVSNGRYRIEKDVPGTVVRIDYPYINGRTTDILVVRWDGQKQVLSMKIKDVRTLGKK